MTTICTDGKTMAADRLVTGDGMCHGYVTKIARLQDGSIVGLAGGAGLFNAFLTWLDNDEGKPFDAPWDMEALRLTLEGIIWCYDKTGNSFQCTAPQAIGSGAAVAYGAMAAGADPHRAVEIACEIDTLTGGGAESMGRNV